jgi:radical SAM superfamily enzyme YgiQ (UPF0313 family)
MSLEETMARVVLIGLYDSWVIGLRNLANALIENGHEVAVIHFKLMVNRKEPFYLKNTLQYQTVDSLTSRKQLLVNSFNTDVQQWTYSELQSMGDLLVDLRPTIIGLSTRSVYEKYILEIAEQMRRVPGSITVAGGHDASFRPEYYLDYVNFACVGEGEETIVQLADSIDNGTDPTQIPNLVWKDNGRIKRNRLAKPREDKDYFYSERQDEVRHYVCNNNRIFQSDALLSDIPGQLAYYYTMVGRGCTGKCAYCTAGHFHGLYSEQRIYMKLRRMRTIERVIAELKMAKNRGFEEITFLDSFLVAPRQYLLAFFHAYEQSISLPFFAQLHPEQVTTSPEVLDAALSAGMNRMVVGIQSGSERVSREVFNRRTSHSRLISFARMMVDRGSLRVDYHIVTHNPFDQHSDFEETLALISELPKKNCSLFLFRLYAFVNTRLHELIREANLGRLDSDVHDKRAAMYLIRWIAPDQVFNDIYRKFDQMSFQDLRQRYLELKKTMKTDVDFVLEAQDHLNKESFAEAINSCDQSLFLNPENYDALFRKGMAFAAIGFADKADVCFKTALKSFPIGTRQVWQRLGVLSQRLKRFGESVRYLERAKFLVLRRSGPSVPSFLGI